MASSIQKSVLFTSSDAWFPLWFKQYKRSSIGQALFIETNCIVTKTPAFE